MKTKSRMKTLQSKRVVFIGGLARNGMPRGGEEMKNKLLVGRLSSFDINLIIVNTSDWRQNPWCLIHLVWVLITIKKETKVLISASHASGRLIKVLPIFVNPHNVVYWSVGGDLDKRIKDQEFSIESLRKLNKVVVQGEKQAIALMSLGLDNVMSIPNSKPIPKIDIPFIRSFTGNFVYVSRIHPQKGVREIIEAAKRIKNTYPSLPFKVDFYGNIERSFKEEFDRLLIETDNCRYCGFLDLTSQSGYETLSNYGCFLFPTYWPGEGFPGAIIDAYISGLPVIATKWNLNEEMVINEYSGYIIQEKDVDSLTRIMELFLLNKVPYLEMRHNCQKEAQKYDINTVLSEALFFEIGLLQR